MGGGAHRGLHMVTRCHIGAAPPTMGDSRGAAVLAATVLTPRLHMAPPLMPVPER